MKLSQTFIVMALLALISFNSVMAQRNDDVISLYSSELKLNQEQQEAFKKVLVEYSPLFDSSKSDVNQWNKVLKERDLKIFQILSAEQLVKFKNVRKEIEPNIFYKNIRG